jgi:hypothetical protein
VSAATFGTIALSFLAGFASPYVLHWLDWMRGKPRRSEDEW